MEFFTGNPFSTPVGRRIEYATRSNVQSEDWGLNMEICDIINETEEGPKDAVRAIKKRIVGNRNFKEVMFTLTVLEACVKNCGFKFHVLVSTREFVEGVLVRTILPKNEPPMIIHDRVLSIIQAWADAFRSSPDLTGVVCVYEELRRKGLEFPQTQLRSPIHTPNKCGPGSIRETPLSPTHQAQPAQQTSPVQNAQDSMSLSPQQMNKMRYDLEVVQSNLKLMSDIMKQVDPQHVQQSDVDLLKQLYCTCKEKQDQMLELIPRIGDETLVEQLLSANDNMNEIFTQYHRIANLLNRQNTRQSSLGDLIDLNPASGTQNQSEQATPVSHTVNSLSSQMAGLSTKVDHGTQRKPHSADELLERNGQHSVLDELTAECTQVQSPGLEDVPDSIPLGSSPQFHWMVEKGMIPVDQNDTMDNIEHWLDVNDDEDLADEGVTTEEFDRFLAGRAKAAERLPSVKELSSEHRPSQP